MADLRILAHNQQQLDGFGRLQSHQWADIPEELSVLYMTGGLKRVRRMVESYFRYRFSSLACKHVRALWQRGEPVLRLRYLGWPLIQLGRLRQTGTLDVCRAHMEILGGAMIDAAAVAAHAPWPEDLPWVAPSAGEFDIEAESNRPPYLGIFEFRVVRENLGCSVHVFLRDFPVVRTGLKRRLWRDKPWEPLKSPVNLEYLQQEVTASARQAGLAVSFELQQHAGVPEPLPPLGSSATALFA